MEEAERASSHAFSMFSAARARMAGAASCVLPPFLPPDRQSPGCSGADSALAPRAVGKEGRRFSRQHFLFS